MACLYVVATPIGNLGDLSDRARNTLRTCATIVAEDTRRTRQLLNSIESLARMVSLNEHNRSRRIGPILEILATEDIALVSDAGTPAISDPGHQLIEAAHAAGYPVRSVPGPSAVVAALSVSGLPATPFTFHGFAPRGLGALRTWIVGWLQAETTSVFFEAPGRIGRTITEIAVADAESTVVICRELTKLFEQVVRGTASELVAGLEDGSIPAKGEFVVVAMASGRRAGVDVDIHLRARLDSGESANDAARQVAKETGRPKSELYKRALALKQSQSD